MPESAFEKIGNSVILVLIQKENLLCYYRSALAISSFDLQQL